MSGNIDKSLGEIISSRKTSTRGGRGRKGGTRAPVGGVAKTVAKAKPSTRASAVAAATAAAAAASSSAKGNKKIMVSGLPSDVNEQQIKDYFGSRVGPVSRVELSYGPNGVSRGVATIIFRGDVAQKAVAENNGVKVDGKPMKVEVIYDAKHLPPAQAPKSLSDRVAEPKKAAAAKKDQPKKVKAATEEKGAAAGRGGRGGKRGRNAGRPKKKTADELDADMMDYFDNKDAKGESAAAAAAPAPAPAAAAAGGEAMDEVL